MTAIYEIVKVVGSNYIVLCNYSRDDHPLPYIGSVLLRENAFHKVHKLLGGNLELVGPHLLCNSILKLRSDLKFVGHVGVYYYQRYSRNQS